MTIFIYQILGSRPYLTSIAKGNGAALEIRVAGVESAMLRIGSITTNIENGVGRVKLSMLGDGIFTPELILKDKTVKLLPICHGLGKVSLACPEQIYTELSTRAYESNVRLARLEEEMQSLKDAVYGKTIF